MDASGPIFAVLALACLFYIVPRQLSWRIPTQAETDQANPLRLATKTVHTGVPVGEDIELETSAAVSTMLMRRAGRRAAGRLVRQAEKRRKTVFAVLLFVALATVPLAVFSTVIQIWVPVATGGVVIAWAIYSHFEAARARKQLDAIVADTELGDDEKTIAVVLAQPAAKPNAEPVAIVGPNGDAQFSLWDPITVVPATYMSAPTAARTVRTIDLSGPGQKVPVTEERRTPRRRATG